MERAPKGNRPVVFFVEEDRLTLLHAQPETQVTASLGVSIPYLHHILHKQKFSILFMSTAFLMDELHFFLIISFSFLPYFNIYISMFKGNETPQHLISS